MTSMIPSADVNRVAETAERSKTKVCTAVAYAPTICLREWKARIFIYTSIATVVADALPPLELGHQLVCGRVERCLQGRGIQWCKPPGITYLTSLTLGNMASATHGSVSPSTSLGPFERRLVSLLEQLKPQLRTLATASGAVRYSVDDALEQLCAKHRDLARQKRNTLRKAVERGTCLVWFGFGGEAKAVPFDLALNVFVQRQQQPGKRVRGSDEDEQLHRSKRKNSNDGGDDDKDGDDGIDSGDGSGGDGEDEDEEEGDGSESGKEDEDSVLYYKKGSSEPIRMMQVNVRVDFFFLLLFSVLYLVHNVTSRIPICSIRP